MLPRAGAATVERRRRCKPKDVATDAAHGFTDTQAQKFPRFECQGFAIHLPHEFTREPTSVGGADLEDDDSPNVPEDATHELLGDLALARKNNERIDFRFEAYTTHLIHNGAILRARECVNNVVVVFVAPSAGEVERLRSRAAPILRRWSRRERPLFLFWNQDRWHETQELIRRQDAGTREATHRTWLVQVLRAPRAILQEPSLSTIHGDRRGLVQLAA